jgi:cyclophilin family peptidyl-prolyl cis-trans isomerase
MRFGPATGFIVLIVVAISVAAYTSSRHPGDINTLPMSERPDPTATPPPPVSNVPKLTFDQARVGAVKVVMDIEGKGPLTLELYQKAAPKTVEQFVNLCKKGFYNGILFHRLVPGFVAQAGDPGSKSVDPASIRNLSPEDAGSKYKLGGGGSGKTIPFEGSNGLTNDTNTLAMALSQPKSATADSQFFINLVDNHRLDGDYCVFGKVVGGTELVSKIQQGDRIKSMKVE